MKNLFLLSLLLILGLQSLQAQKYFTREGNISFYSDAPLEKIEAHNQKATSVLDAASGKMEFAVLIKAFQFEKALMQEHFNENYMESSQFPKAAFKGRITDLSKVDFSKEGEYETTVKGELTIKGVTKEVEAPARFAIKSGQISAESSFEATVADFDIKIPSVVRENIAKTVRIDVKVDYQLLKK